VSRKGFSNLEEPAMDELGIRVVPMPWNKGKVVGQKAPLKLKEIWAIRVRLQIFCRTRELALFDLGIDSKLRACDLLQLKVRDVCHGERIAARAIVVQKRPEGRCSSRSQSRPEPLSPTGLSGHVSHLTIFSFQVVSVPRLI
jgi:hypothetical protein